MHFEVDISVPRPLDDRSLRFLTDVQRSANRVLRLRGDDECITLTVEARGLDGAAALRIASREAGQVHD